MKRGDIVTVALSGDYGKPRPAVIIQSDDLAETDSVLVCLITSTQRATPQFRLAVEPSLANGLREASDVMADKIMAVRRERTGNVIGRLESLKMADLSSMLAIAVGLADTPAA